MKKMNFVLVLVFAFSLIGFVSSYTITNYDYSSGSVSSSYYSTALTSEDCSGGSDFLVQIEPLSCEPLLVTSDLLEEEPVTVYCKVVATQINPFIDVNAISSITITGDYSSDVQSVGYFPSESALGYWYDGSLDNTALNDLGYVAITLRQNANESSMPDYVNGILTARLTYDVEGSFGIGNAQYYLPVLNDADFEDDSVKYSFWDGRGYARALSVDDEGATIALYTSSFQRIGTAQLDKGETSDEFYIPNLNPCLATLKVKLNSLVDPDTRVKLKVNSDYIEVSSGESFLDGACSVKSISKNGLNQQAKIYCKGDEKSSTFVLTLTPTVSLNIDGETGVYSVGDYLYTDESNQNSVYLGYVGTTGNSEDENDLYVVLVSQPYSGKANLSSSDISSLAEQMNLLFANSDTGASAIDLLKNLGSKIVGATITAAKWSAKGDTYAVLDLGGSTDLADKSVSLKGYGGAQNIALVALDSKTYTFSGSGDNYLDGYSVLDDSGDAVGLTLSYSVNSVSDSTPKIFLLNSSGSKVATFYGVGCTAHSGCTEYTLSETGLGFEKGDYNGFFDGVVSGTIYIENNNLALTYLTSEGEGSDLSNYYSNSMADYETLINSYSSQTTDVSTETYGERGLYEAIQLAYSIGQIKTMLEFCDNFKTNYPDSEKDISVCDNDYKQSNSGLATHEIQVDGKTKIISFEGVYEPSYNEYGAEVIVKGPNGATQSYELTKGKKVYLYGLRDGADSTNTEYIELSSVDTDSAKIIVNVLKESTTSKLFETNTQSFDIGDSESFGGYVVTLKDTNLEQSAKVTIIPSFNYKDSESDFNFSIGIEKRTILLTDDMIQNRIEKLNNSMATLNNIVGGLDTFNRYLGGACLVTGGYLTLKNLIANSDGSAIARNEVMTGSGGWTEICKKAVSAGTYSSLEDCYYKNSDAIDVQVDNVQKVIADQNNVIKNLQETYSNNGVLNKTAFTQSYSSSVSSSLSDMKVSSLDTSDGKSDSISISDITSLIDSSEAFSQGIYDSEDLKTIQLYAELYTSATDSTEKSSYQDKLYSSLSNLMTNAESYVKAQELKDESGLENSFVMDLDSKTKTTEVSITEHETFEKSSYSSYGFQTGTTKIESSDCVATITSKSSGSTYLFSYYCDGQKEGVVKGTYEVDTTNKILTVYGYDEKTGKTKTNPFSLYFKKYDSADYENKYSNAELQYYESGSYDEYPAVVPLDTGSGWYVGVKDSDSGVAAYDASGKVRIIWLCNVGKNGLEEFSLSSNSYGDDKCQQYDLTHDVVAFSGLTSSQTNTLLKKAQTSIEAAQKAYKSGVSSVTIGGTTYKVGEPASSSSEIQCESYMSPKDCKLLFNVCDPVVCPSSRCDFGGNYPVSDVVQTGVVGSVLLCAPNYKEGIYLPVCTTGIEAGLKSWVNVEESYRDCLQEYLDNGEVTGTCDKIHSIYACEFFWKEAIPLAKIGISKAASAISGENVRGGSEYLTLSSAWQNAQDSFDYFTQYYAAESYDAFKIRSAEEAGSAVCKVSASVVYSSGADLLDSLVTPRSPAQYTGSFEETTLTTTTNPPTSHYKVYYYIYAGEDTGVTYQVYLKGSSSSYYQDSSSTYNVDSGYISSGDYATDTVDFSASSGYTQLCISVNGEVECGFGKVSTSFAENYITDSYLSEQASTTDITTEDECTSGTASWYSLINPNLQDIVGSLTDTDLYADGITRTCASESPGKDTDASWNTEDARWRDVGYCGDTSVRCWIDTDTVKEAIKSLNLESAALDDTLASYIESLTESGAYLSTSNYTTKVSEIKDETDPETKIKLIDAIINKVFYSNQKAQLYLLRGMAYGSLAKDAYAIIKDITALSSEDTTSTSSSENETESTSETSTTSTDDLEALAKKIAAYSGYFVSETQACSIQSGYTIATCYNSVTVLYDNLGVSEPTCVFSVEKGTTIPTGEKVADEYGSDFGYDCGDTGSLSESEKLALLKPAYQFDAVIPYSGDSTGSANYAVHSLIFLNWSDKSNNIATVLDWNGVTYNVGSTNTVGQDCEGEFIHTYSSGNQKCKTYRIYTIDLSDDENYVYLIRGYPSGTASSSSSSSSTTTTTVGDLSEAQTAVYNSATTCDGCVATDSNGNSLCDENLCTLIGEKIKMDCIQDNGKDGTCIVNDDAYLSWTSFDEVQANVNMFSDAEQEAISGAAECGDCGDGLINLCDAQECKAISLKLGIDCSYSFLSCK